MTSARSRTRAQAMAGHRGSPQTQPHRAGAQPGPAPQSLQKLDARMNPAERRELEDSRTAGPASCCYRASARPARAPGQPAQLRRRL